jgi:hypothetical protein
MKCGYSLGNKSVMSKIAGVSESFYDFVLGMK